MIIQYIKFETALSENEILTTSKERANQFRLLPGLLQKYYVKSGQPNHYGGIYIWDSEKSMKSYRESDLAATIPSAYKIVGAPAIETLDVLFKLRE